jgi:CheY-like chemotaxis protein
MTFNGRRVLVVEGDFLVSLATTDLLKNFGCETIGPAASLAAAVQLAQSEALDTALLDINIAGEMIWPAAAALQYRGVPFLFVAALAPRMIFRAPFAAAPRLDKPLARNRLLRDLSAIWSISR